MLKLGLPTPNPSQEGNAPLLPMSTFPSWEGLGVGKHTADDEIFQITFQVVFFRFLYRQRQHENVWELSPPCMYEDTFVTVVKP